MHEWLSFTIIGVPQTAGSKRAFKNPKTQAIIITESGNAAAKKTWRTDVRDAAHHAIEQTVGGPWPTSDPVEVDVIFFRPRPKTHYAASGLLKPWAVDLAPISAPDSTKLWRAAEDALEGVLYVNDAQVVRQVVEKTWGPAGARIAVRVYRSSLRHDAMQEQLHLDG